MKGFLFDGTLHDSINAAKYYQEFLNKYPNNQFAKDAKMLLQNLGKSDEEVLKDLMEKTMKKITSKIHIIYLHVSFKVPVYPLNSY